MTLNELLKQKKYKEIWQEYCSFVDLSLADYMEIQKRLMYEQIDTMYKCELGRRFMSGKKPETLNEYRKTVPLTTYGDYADVLSKKKTSALPSEPIIWIEATRGNGRNPAKAAPYTEGMIKAYRRAFISAMIFATSQKKGAFSLRRNDCFLYGMASLPHLTGLGPYVLDGEIDMTFLPDQKQAEKLSFGPRSRLGFYLGTPKGVDLYFDTGDAVIEMSEHFLTEEYAKASLQRVLKNSPRMSWRLGKAWARKKLSGKPTLPKDIWRLKGLIYTRADALPLKAKIEEYWGVKPLEIFSSAESTCIGTETWSKNGMVLFPDACFYEFIPEAEWEKTSENPQYVPKTYLMDELAAGLKYELVISNYKGGAFMRYRVGDTFKCLSLKNEKEGVNFPQFEYIDRVSSIIDVAGVARITEETFARGIEQAL